MRNHSYENDFDLHENATACRTHFHMKDLVHRLVLKQRHKRTWKWPNYFVVLSFENIYDWKLSLIRLTFLFRLAILPRLISLAHWATELNNLFSLARVPGAIGPGFPPALHLMYLCTHGIP